MSEPLSDQGPEIINAESPEELASLAAEILARTISTAVLERGVARVALSGGSTPARTYEALAAMALPFESIEWFWVDERAVPPDHPRSNYGAASRQLRLADGQHGKAHRMVAEGDLDVGARAYEDLLRRMFGVASSVAFDAMVLGIGDDGHTASLFPNTGSVLLDDRLVAAIPANPERGLEARMTLTVPAIVEARFTIVLVQGRGKRSAMQSAMAVGSDDEVPARVIRRSRGDVVWVVDREARGTDDP